MGTACFAHEIKLALTTLHILSSRRNGFFSLNDLFPSPARVTWFLSLQSAFADIKMAKDGPGGDDR
jgi:hypothetical protein